MIEIYSESCLIQHALGENVCVGLHSGIHIENGQMRMKSMSDNTVKMDYTGVG